MKNTIVLITLIVAMFAVVSPAYADDGGIKPVCTVNDTWLDALFGKCIAMDTDHTVNVSAGTSEHVQPDKTANPSEAFPTMNQCENWTRIFKAECNH